jgi:hypothetical protein
MFVPGEQNRIRTPKGEEYVARLRGRRPTVLGRAGDAEDTNKTSLRDRSGWNQQPSNLSLARFSLLETGPVGAECL